MRALRTRTNAVARVELAPTTLKVVFAQGMLTNVLNPKVALFFLAFLPQFADPECGAIATQIIALGLLFNISGTLVNVLVAMLASEAGAYSRLRIADSAFMRRLSGVVFLGLAVRLAFLERK